MKKRAFGKLYKELFYVPKHEKLTEKVFRCRMITSLLTILACTAVMAASTFALFYSEVSTDHSTIASAYYSVMVDNAENGTYICPLTFEDKHTFEIKSDGTASIGYCKIQIEDRTYYTVQIPKGESIILTIQAARGSKITFIPQWGEQTEAIKSAAYKSGDTIPDSITPHAVYKIEPVAKLSAIAEYYGVPEAEIMIYNNLLAAISDDSDGAVGLKTDDQLKIPGEVALLKDEYKVPYETYKMEPTAKIDDIARYYDVPADDILAFNDPKNLLLHGELKIPYAAKRDRAYSVPFSTYKVEPTAKLDAISEYYKIAEVDILAYNDIPEIKVGETIRIPGVPENTKPYAVPFATYKVEPTAKLDIISFYYKIDQADILAYNNITGIVVGETIRIPGVPENTTPYAVPFATYKIEPTARLAAISIYYDVSINDILAYNNLSSEDFIIADTILKIPSAKAVEKTYSVPYAVYVVQPTAKIENIATHYGVTVSMIKRFNDIEVILPGKELKIPYAKEIQTYTVPSVDYIVPEGATIDKIAEYYKLNSGEILAFNSIPEIKAGDIIKIPSVSEDVPPYSPPVKPEETTPAPEQITVPEETKPSPEQTAAPEETTSPPEQTTVPEETTSPPEQTTAPAES